MTNQDGMTYAPKGKPSRVVEEGDFTFAAIALDHGHIYGMCNGLMEAGAVLKSVYDPDPVKLKQFKETYPNVQVASSEQEILSDPDVQLIAGAAIPSERAALGIRTMEAGKDYFTDKTPFTSLEQLEQAKITVERTGKKYMVYYSERLHVESAVYAGQLIQQGAIGDVLQVTGFGPHRLNAPNRPAWFFKKKSNTAAFFAISAAIKLNSFCSLAAAPMPAFSTAKWRTIRTLTTLSLKITAMPRCSAIPVRLSIFALTGIRRTG